MVGLQKHGGRNFLPSWISPGWTFCLPGFLLAGLHQTGPSLRSADGEAHWWTKARNAYMEEHGQILAAAGRSERERWGSGQKFWAIVTISWAETPPTFHLMCHRKFWCCSPNADWWMKRGRRLVRWVCICKTFDHTTQPACRSQEALMMVNGNQKAPLCPLFYAVMQHLPKILFYSEFPVQSSKGEKASPH